MKTHFLIMAAAVFAFTGCLSGGSSVVPDPDEPPARFAGAIALTGSWGEVQDPNVLYFDGSLDTLSFLGDSVRVQTTSWSDLGGGSAVTTYAKGTFAIEDGLLSLNLTGSDAAYAKVHGDKSARSLIVQDFSDKIGSLKLWENAKTRNFQKVAGRPWKTLPTAL